MTAAATYAAFLDARAAAADLVVSDAIAEAAEFAKARRAASFALDCANLVLREAAEALRNHADDGAARYADAVASARKASDDLEKIDNAIDAELGEDFDLSGF